MTWERVCFFWGMCRFTVFVFLLRGAVSDVSFEMLKPTTLISRTVTPCGEGLCRCNYRFADCGSKLRQVSYIPQLPDHIDIVDLSWNKLSTTILTPNVFQNLTNIVELDISNNNLSWVPRSVFKGMTKLTSLTLDENDMLEVDTLREVMSIDAPFLSSVKARGCNLPPLPEHLLNNLTLKVEDLHLEFNSYSGSYSVDALCDLQHEFGLFLSDCDVEDLTSSCQVLVPSLDLRRNSLRMFPTTCIGEESIFPRLRGLVLAYNRIHTLSTSQICLPYLEYLDLSHNNIQFYPTGAFGWRLFPSLRTLTLSHQLSYQKVKAVIRDRAFDNRRLDVLVLNHNQLDIADRENMGTFAFYNCSELTELQFGSSNFNNVNDQRFSELFGNLSALTVLSLPSTQLDLTLGKTFRKFAHLQVLDLRDNRISAVPDGALDSLPLTRVLLGNNRISLITERTFGPDLRQRLTRLDLSLNPFECSCELLWFQHWFQSHPERLTNPTAGLADYKCSNMPGVTLASFSMADQACLLSRETNLLIIQFSVFVIAAMTLTSLVFGFRWHIRLLLYEAFRGRDNLRRQRLQANNFDFDVFVSFSSQDLPWVRQHLMPKLEGELGLRLCVHERDFIVGRHIVDNVVDSVHSSKKILMVFSADFARSEWCQFELSVCLTHVMDFDDAMIVVCVDDVAARGVTSAMKAVMKTTTYIQWQENDDMQAEAMFWRRLHLAMHEILPP